MEIRAASDQLTSETVNRFLSETIERLLKKLFPDRRLLRYRAITPGMSGAGVLRVDPQSRGPAEQPCVVKIGRASDIRREVGALKKYADRHVRSKYLPALKGYEFEAGEVGAIAYEFVGNSSLNSVLVQRADTGDVRGVVALTNRLLSMMQPLWGLEKTQRKRNLMRKDYPLVEVDLANFERLAATMPIYDAPRAEDVQLVRRLWSDEIRVIGDLHHVGICHGDFFGNNVLVDADEDLCLIDFAHMKHHHYLRDLLTLEGDLVLRLLPSGPDGGFDRFAIERLAEVLTADFVPAKRPKASEDALAAAVGVVRAIRLRAWRRMEHDPREIPAYQLGLLRRLVRTSSRLENGLATHQRWAGAYLAAVYARTLVHPPSKEGQPPGRSSSVRRVRTATGARDTPARFEAKLSLARARTTPSFALVGGTYLDVSVGPFRPSMAIGTEMSNLDPVTVQLGGSCIQVGRALLDAFDTRSHLFTSIGDADDVMSREVKRLLDREPWIDHMRAKTVPGVMSAVSVHLGDPTAAEMTVLTHRGALEHLSWPAVAADLLADHEDGGFLYIGGYFRTHLRERLLIHLRSLGLRQIVVLDHGGLVPEMDNAEAVRALKQAMSHGLIDVYICTFDELWTLATFEEESSPPVPTVELVQQLTRQVGSPTVTVVRDATWPGRTSACVSIDGKDAQLVTVEPVLRPLPNRVGADNAFNAGFMHGLANTTKSTLRSAVLNATRVGIRTWLSVDE